MWIGIIVRSKCSGDTPGWRRGCCIVGFRNRLRRAFNSNFLWGFCVLVLPCVHCPIGPVLHMLCILILAGFRRMNAVELVHSVRRNRTVHLYIFGLLLGLVGLRVASPLHVEMSFGIQLFGMPRILHMEVLSWLRR